MVQFLQSLLRAGVVSQLCAHSRLLEAGCAGISVSSRDDGLLSGLMLPPRGERVRSPGRDQHGAVRIAPDRTLSKSLGGGRKAWPGGRQGTSREHPAPTFPRHGPEPGEGPVGWASWRKSQQSSGDVGSPGFKKWCSPMYHGCDVPFRAPSTG